MVITTTGLNQIATSSLSEFDDISHMMFGSGDSLEDPTDTALESEHTRVALQSHVKDSGAGTYTDTAKLTLTQGNNLIAEIGTSNASSGGELGQRLNPDSSFTKTDDDEIIVVTRVTSSAVNN